MRVQCLGVQGGVEGGVLEHAGDLRAALERAVLLGVHLIGRVVALDD